MFLAPRWMYHLGMKISMLPRPSLDRVVVGVNLNVAVLPGLESPITVEVEVTDVTAAGMFSSLKKLASKGREEAAGSLHALLAYDLTLMELIATADHGLKKLVN